LEEISKLILAIVIAPSIPLWKYHSTTIHVSISRGARYDPSYVRNDRVTFHLTDREAIILLPN
jgi:hypothetical protein